ncbi:putative E3 ubiquitin-protein ligase RHA2B [Platanthera guangdongensis]|uniref:E3 ubiquitin-protein ligase RHA2B n=1 Tax=Platanthera guangdongensis TaxID=2320717 RepID=A0ABR2M227_9ASPA
MGLSSLPTPSEGVLTLLLVNTALTISLLKEIFRSVLHVFGISPEASPSAADGLVELPYLWFPAPSAEPSLTEKFRSRIKPVRFGSAVGRRRAAEWHPDCRVCLARFEMDSVVNRLPCGHLFHKSCVEQWLDYQNETCPLCRSHLLPTDDASGGGGGGGGAFPVWGK